MVPGPPGVEKSDLKKKPRKQKTHFEGHSVVNAAVLTFLQQAKVHYKVAFKVRFLPSWLFLKTTLSEGRVFI